MKVAFIYSGAMRSFDACWKNHRWMLWRHFPDAKFTVCTSDDEDAFKADTLTNLLGRERVTIRRVTQPEMVIPTGCPDEWTPGKPYMHEPYHISVDPRAVLGQLWMLREGWRLYQEANDPADLIIRCRPDLWFHSFELPLELVGHQGVNKYAPPWSDELPLIAWTPWWGRFGNGCNDRFALLGNKAAEAYFCAWDRINGMIESGAPLHPETLVGSSVMAAKCNLRTKLKAEFSTLRKSGEMRPPEITMIDLAHAAMR